ncbi:hypothetical protein SAMN04487905_103232 [Actinopolyspora xinjiangensis]|uniref:Ketohydroxyglutarate aldolase n=1 Tax=Actinopolyspora xinjiangensis TaxID=405564 RepID=A0A1H0RVD4_9ACTN|nr:hypothetical protein [Actinopolyspora xinjiangensis]SDP32946.1 hypothetical protein SAMN04487905_103232 [Actinopolyspora xinjiangensis]
MSEEVVVTVGDEWVDHIGTVAERLRQAGMRVERVLELVGVITGSLDAELFDAASTVPGVVSVERTGTMWIPPGETGE